MDFRMVCPKCRSYDYSIERDQRFGVQDDEWFGLIFSCRCGRQLFGHQVREEYDRQHKEWLSSRDARGPEREAPVAQDKRAETVAPTAEATKPTRETVADHDHDHDHDHDLDEDVEDSEICAWAPCSNPRRNNSMYCSRSCSNKNARWRYKQRQRKEQQAA